MLIRVLRYVRLPIVLIALWAILRFVVGASGVPYAPRGNAMFSVAAITVISCLYFGAMSGKIGGFGWAGTALTGAVLGFVAQVLIFTLTLVSFLAGMETFYTHWDALNLPEGSTAVMGPALGSRVGGLIFGTLFGVVFACVGRLFARLAPDK